MENLENVELNPKIPKNALNARSLPGGMFKPVGFFRTNGYRPELIMALQPPASKDGPAPIDVPDSDRSLGETLFPY